ncbi:hypothetical protein [Micromonospora sp. MA102]|uniref:hypothetical protein n=1 Tax=Micromonospora sp. MA102 TaxID=2952755 RepID=UPI0021C9ED0C|nr:hypothetical protein [Micromonospora sp. MA102]
MSAFQAAVVRQRRTVLAIALAISVGYPLVLWFAGSDHKIVDVLVIGLLVGSLILLALLGYALPDERPAVFVVRPEVSSFSTPSSSVAVWGAVALALAASAQISSVVRPIWTHNLRPLDAVLPVLVSALAGRQMVLAWCGFLVHLRPEGLWWRTLAGSVRVPWEALAPGYPQRPALYADTLTLTYARPDLVRRRGLVLRPRRLPIKTVDAWFISDAIWYYLAHPEHRAAIGTEAEYRRLLDVLRDRPADPAPHG